MPRRSGSKTPAEIVSGQVPRSVALMVPITPRIAQRTRKDGAPSVRFLIKPSAVSVPDWISLGIAQGKGVVSFYYFPREKEFTIRLLDFRAGERDLISLAEVHAHVVHEGLGAEIDIDRIRPIFHQQMGDLFLAALGRQLDFLDGSLDLCLRLKIVLRRDRPGGFLCADGYHKKDTDRKKEKYPGPTRVTALNSTSHSSASQEVTGVCGSWISGKPTDSRPSLLPA